MERPYIHINVAATADGKIDTVERHGASISSGRDKERVDRLRAEADAVMVGGRTLHDETPKLTVKSERLREQRLARGLPANPAKVGIASKLELEPDCEFLTAGPARIMLFTTLQTGQAQLAMLRSRNAEVFVLGEDHVDLAVAMGVLNKHGVRRLLVEGGGSLNFELMDLGLADELTAYIAPIIFGGATAPTMADGAGRPGTAALPLKLVRSEAWEDGGVLLHYQFLKEG